MSRLKADAKKDAEDMARANAFYGKGAGTRRKKVKNRISEKLKDPDYKAEYEKNLAKQDMSKHQEAADRERRSEDRNKQLDRAKRKMLRVGRGVRNLMLGFGTTSLAAIAIYNVIKTTQQQKEYRKVFDGLDKYHVWDVPNFSVDYSSINNTYRNMM